MAKIRCIKDVVAAGLCSGCGACRYAFPEHVIRLENVYEQGIQPVVEEESCDGSCLSVCPGYSLTHNTAYKANTPEKAFLVGQYEAIYEGYAQDSDIRFNASSGGILTAVACYCLEKEHMQLVLHTGMNEKCPWENITVVSNEKSDLLKHAGSRYNTSSPCESLELIEAASEKSVFIGRPCDVAAVRKASELRPKLKQNIGIALTFFCAGTPSTGATVRLLCETGADTEGMKSLRYRGEGWPGGFHARYEEPKKDVFISYEESWGSINRDRPVRCALCPDGLGEYADISSGDAWHRRGEEENDGISIILPRTSLGTKVLRGAADSGYISMVESDIHNLLSAQPLIQRRTWNFGQILGMHMVGLPVPRYRGFHLMSAWFTASMKAKIKSLAYWRRVKWPRTKKKED